MLDFKQQGMVAEELQVSYTNIVAAAVGKVAVG